MATTCKLIAKSELGSATSTVTFSSIPGTYTDLFIVVAGRSSSGNATTANADFMKMALNSTAMSSVRYLYGLGGYSPTADAKGSATSPLAVGHLADPNCTSNTFASIEIYIPNYAGTTAKSFSSTGVVEHNGAVAPMAAWAGLYSSVTSAVTSVEFTTNNAANFVSGSSFFLYGILKA
jgi:hypothetical protein